MARIALIIISIFYCVIAHAGAWVQEKGHGLNIFTVRRYISTQFWTSGGRLQGSPTYAKNEMDDYIEYGLTEKLTLGLYLSALRSHTAAAGTQGGSNNNQFFGRYLLWKSNWSAFSAQFFADALGRAAKFNIPPNNRFNTGEAILFGTGGRLGRAENRYWFIGTLLGLVQRYSAGNQIQFNLEGGLKFPDSNVVLLLQNYNTFNLDHPTYPQGTGYNLITIAPSVVYWVTKTLGLQLGIAQDIYGQNVGKGRAPFMAGWIQF
ncbi:hypothetical protein [Aquicella lusitana]|uniref:Uncharacterized protein n=1 Tax=Aquicella lusitana TaxID=254246 RepID=A0A370GYL1_9COXI|nr:hypothetical protein [Aquicella lusitana]RDI48733.1 hypothetical protein C8D86_10112 [Aquicella lusitana]VVC73161.1 hypothetical protein AQULUS_08930 [Aquicella lusitana]